MIQNTSLEKHHLHSHQKIFEASTGYHQREIFLLPICGLSVLENLAVCSMIYCYRSLHNTTNVFIFGLCITNCLFVGVLLPMHCFERANEAYLYLTIIIILIYICNLTAVTLERYIAIIRPLHYVNIITKKRAVRVVIACYLLPTIYCLIPMAWDGSRQTIGHKIYISITLVVFLILPLIFILSVYFKVYRETHKFYKKHRTLFQNKNTLYKKDKDMSNEEQETSLLQEASFICCLFTKKIKETSSFKYYNSDIESNSKTSESEIMLNNPSMLLTQQSSLYKSVLRTSIEVDESSMFGGDDVFENNNEDGERVNKEHEKNKNISYQETPLMNNNFQKKPDQRLTDSIRHRMSSGTSNSLGSFKAQYVKKRRKAKARLTELKASLAFAMVSLSYMFTWLPVVYMTFLEVIDRTDKIPVWLSTISIYTIAFSTMIDPLVYGLMLRDFRQAIKSTLRKRKKRSINR